jgi:hypothetical protein
VAPTIRTSLAAGTRSTKAAMVRSRSAAEEDWNNVPSDALLGLAFWPAGRIEATRSSPLITVVGLYAATRSTEASGAVTL